MNMHVCGFLSISDSMEEFRLHICTGDVAGSPRKDLKGKDPILESGLDEQKLGELVSFYRQKYEIL